MLSIAKITDARVGASYFEKDDYYFDSEQRAPSRWWGRGAARLGLDGLVDRDTFARLLDGELPDGTKLARRQGKDHQPGVDLTFSAPKSVSLLALVGRDDQVLAAHERAVSEALAYVEHEAAQARVTEAGVTSTIPTHNLVVARFNHDTSRAQDPQLHTHAVVLNATERDGAWRALTQEALFRHKMVAGLIYRSQLAHELQATGYTLRRTHPDGRFEVEGFTAEQLRAFSKRRGAIEEALAERGLEGPEAAAQAALRTRDNKTEIDRKELHARWHAEARALKVRFPAKAQARSPVLDQSSGVTTAAVDNALAHLSERAAVFADRDVYAHALAVGLMKAPPAEVRAEIDARREAGAVRPAEPLHRLRNDLGPHYTTPEAIATEKAMIAAVHRGQERVAPIMEAGALARALESRRLTEGQREALHLALTSPHRVVGVQGYAGTGKTTALRTLRELAEQNGYRVRGLAPSATAAKLITDEAGIQSQTVASFLLEVGRATSADAEPTLWVVDELSMVGNKATLAILEAAERRHARVILLGDRDQLPSIEAGRAFALLADRGLPLVSMDQILRQENPLLLDAVRATISHDTDRALSILQDSITTIPNRTKRLAAIANAYLDVPTSERDRALVLTGANADRVELNDRIRNGLRAMGLLSGPEVRATILRSRGFTGAQIRESTAYSEGDVIRFQRAYHRKDIGAGETFRVVSINPATNMVELERGDRRISWQPHKQSRVEVYQADARHLAAGDRIRWTRNDKGLDRRNGEHAEVLFVAPDGTSAEVRVRRQVQVLDLTTEPYWEHAYATTVHAAQGRTADRVLLHLDTSRPNLLGHESFYVGVSRARYEVRIFTDDVDQLPLAISRPLAQASALESVDPYRDRRERVL